MAMLKKDTSADRLKFKIQLVGLLIATVGILGTVAIYFTQLRIQNKIEERRFKLDSALETEKFQYVKLKSIKIALSIRRSDTEMREGKPYK